MNYFHTIWGRKWYFSVSSEVNCCSMAHKRWLVIGFVYGLLIEFWSFCALGIGHGTALPLFISFAPVSLIGFVGSIESMDSTPPGWLTVVLLLAPALMWALAAFLLVRAISYYR